MTYSYDRFLNLIRYYFISSHQHIGYGLSVTIDCESVCHKSVAVLDMPIVATTVDPTLTVKEVLVQREDTSEPRTLIEPTQGSLAAEVATNSACAVTPPAFFLASYPHV